MEYTYNKLLDEGYYTEYMDNGLKVMVYPMEHKTSVFAMLSARVGSSTLDFVVDGKKVHVPEGTAHYLEHKMFENESGIDAFELFAKTGASANAYTSFDKTCYLFEASLDAEKSLETIIQFVGSPYFTDETVQKEQGIIGQEIKMYLDNPSWRLLFGTLSLLYFDHPVKEDIAGSVESISEITPEKLYDFYNAFYNPANMVLTISGNISPERAFEICRDEFSKKEWKKHETSVILHNEKDEVSGSYIKEEMPISSPQFCLGYKEIPFAAKDRMKSELAADMLLYIMAGDTSDLYRRMYDEGTINGGLSSEILSGDDYLCCTFSAESEDPDKAASEIREEILRIKKEGVTEERFLECKRAFIGDTLSEFEGVDSVATNLTYTHFKNGDIYDIIEQVEGIERTDVEDMLGKLLRDTHSALAVIVPKIN